MLAESLILASLASALATALLGWKSRRKLVSCVISNAELMAELELRGIDLEHHAMESYVNKQYEVLRKLGEGSSGEVWRVKRRSDGEILAMKKIAKFGDGRHVNDEESLQTEIACLRRLRHRHIVNLVEVTESQKTLWIIMECADGGGLYDRIVALEHFSEASAARIVKQILKAVHYMHSMGVVHRDLKPENVLLESKAPDADIKVADFGLAVELGFEGYQPDESMKLKNSKGIAGGFCGSPICMAPEVADRNAAYGPQCDIYSVGCLLHELVCGHPPYTASNCQELFAKIHISDGPTFDDEIWESVSEDAKDLVSKMLQRSPGDRPSAKEALAHPWFREAPDDHLDEAQQKIQLRRSGSRRPLDPEFVEAVPAWHSEGDADTSPLKRLKGEFEPTEAMLRRGEMCLRKGRTSI